MARCPQCSAVLVDWPQLPAFDGRPLEVLTIKVCPTCPPEDQPDPHPQYDGYAVETLITLEAP